jgi:hypothetical protein
MLPTFLASLADMPWLLHAGKPRDDAVVVPDVATGWDDWSPQMAATWIPRSQALEELARAQIGDAAIDAAFQAVAAAINDPLRSAIRRYFHERPDVNENTASGADRGLWPDLLDTIQRDIAWAAVETLLAQPGFFTHLLTYYREGRWPCSWQGEYPEGRVVLL